MAQLRLVKVIRGPRLTSIRPGWATCKIWKTQRIKKVLIRSLRVIPSRSKSLASRTITSSGSIVRGSDVSKKVLRRQAAHQSLSKDRLHLHPSLQSRGWPNQSVRPIKNQARLWALLIWSTSWWNRCKKSKFKNTQAFSRSYSLHRNHEIKQRNLLNRLMTIKKPSFRHRKKGQKLSILKRLRYRFRSPILKKKKTSIKSRKPTNKMSWIEALEIIATMR